MLIFRRYAFSFTTSLTIMVITLRNQFTFAFLKRLCFIGTTDLQFTPRITESPNIEKMNSDIGGLFPFCTFPFQLIKYHLPAGDVGEINVKYLPERISLTFSRVSRWQDGVSVEDGMNLSCSCSISGHPGSRDSAQGFLQMASASLRRAIRIWAREDSWENK